MVLMNEAMRTPLGNAAQRSNGVNVNEIRLPLHSLDKRHLYGADSLRDRAIFCGQSKSSKWGARK